mmetsp:Transcript_130605/g.194544  ORF Transcript_130605/g.194544 Transcript_130605/m.194544 type:complete len:734 (-) Transcript_130605:56-2257(-)
MGLLDAGTPLSWAEGKQYAAHVKKHGVEQFISIYNNNKDLAGSPFLWGDEVEYFIATVDDENTRTELPALRAPELLRELDADAQSAVPVNGEGKGVVWHPEYANWMIEATPALPYGGKPEDLLEVETNMRLRREILSRHLKDDEALVTLPAYARLGAANFAGKAMQPQPNGSVSKSLYIPDDAIQPHPRFPTLTSNIRQRRGEKVMIAVPVFQDEHTHKTIEEQAEQIRAQPGGDRVLAELPQDSIYMDAMAFGMGAGCLQVTFQAADVSEARELYDQLAVMAPIMLALTAASPVWKGMLADIDARWDIISASVDDRTRGERGLAEAQGSEQRIHKSRYSSIDTYIADSALNRASMNDVPVPINEEAMARLVEAGVDEAMAKHVAHLFVRDPLVVYREKLEQDDKLDNDHFENIQSTNWNTVRFKPPPAKNPHDIKWRVEFRSMEVNVTDFENAAFSAFMILFAQTIKAQQLDLYMPISQVDANMARAHRRGAALAEKFHFRSNIARSENVDANPEVAELSMDQIINGDAAANVVGLVDLVRAHLRSQECAPEARARLEMYLDFVAARASGEIPTAAAWLREFVVTHPGYKQDSVVSEAVCYDLIKEVAAMGAMQGRVAELLGAFAQQHSFSSAKINGAASPVGSASGAETEVAAERAASLTRSSSSSSMSSQEEAVPAGRCKNCQFDAFSCAERAERMQRISVWLGATRSAHAMCERPMQASAGMETSVGCC